MEPKQDYRLNEPIIECDCCQKSSDGVEEIPAATKYCTECMEHQCSTCSEFHGKLNASKHHVIIDIDDFLKRTYEKSKSLTDSTVEITCVSCQIQIKNDCTHTVTDSRQLSCSHTFCLKCLNVLEKDNALICPVCRKQMSISQQDFSASIRHETTRIYDSSNRVNSLGTINENAMDNFSNCVSTKESDLDADGDAEFKLSEVKETHTSTKTKAVVATSEEDGARSFGIPSKNCTNCHGRQCDHCRLKQKQRVGPRGEHNIGSLQLKTNAKANFSTTVCSQCCKKIGRHESSGMHCINCKRNMCNECSEKHKRQKLWKEHKIVPIPLKSNSMNVINTASKITPKKPALTKTGPSQVKTDYHKLDKTSKDIPNGKLNTSHLPRRRDSKFSHIDVFLNKLALSLNDATFSRAQKILQKPIIREDDLGNFWERAIPYITQRIKMWNGNVVAARNLVSLITRSEIEANPTGRNSSKKLPKDKKKTPVSRLDCLTYMINASDFIVVQDILRILSKFSLAIPMVVQDINECNKFIVTIPFIQNIEVKWESAPGEIVENHLFTDDFYMIIALRLGKNKIGKSTILNQLLRKQFVFSSCSEAGSGYGRPLTLDGSVEIVLLTQETCSESMWNDRMLDYYKGNTNKVAILANLHGDASEHEDTLKYLIQLPCSFIVFLMPGFDQKQWSRLKQLLSKRLSDYIFIDPLSKTNVNKIQTSTLTSDDTQDIMRQLLYKSLSNASVLESSNLEIAIELRKSLKKPSTYENDNCEQILAMVQNQGCYNIRQLLGRVEYEEQVKWAPEIDHLIELWIGFMNCPRQHIKQAVSSFETRLSQLSSKESMSARLEVREASEKLRRIIKSPTKSNLDENSKETNHDQELNDAREKLKSAMQKAGNINLGQEHFFRFMGQLYESNLIRPNISLEQKYNVQSLPSLVAELLIQGHAIELLNGDSGEIQILWMKAICDTVTKEKPDLKVFIISIIGLQSSGKSTLLNALFSCRFAVSVGRCSRGLYMRMIMLEDDLRQACGCDAIILIDTEGLCSPEMMNDPRASHKDRLMAAYAMGVSNLTIVNILGEGMNEMTEILQIAIVAMARLRGGGIRPDLLMVQHLQEKNLTKIEHAKNQFIEAINTAFELIKKNDVEIGAASAECLDELTTRIQSGDLFQHFGPFKDGSSVNSPPSQGYHEDVVSLFETLLGRIGSSKQMKTFERWSHHFESYWTCVREENFALNFKNVKHITDFLYFEKKIASVKELADRAIRKHKETFVTQIKEQISKFIEEKRKIETETMKNEMMESIEKRFSMIPLVCPDYCQFCTEFNHRYNNLLQEILGTEWENETKTSLAKYNEDLRERSKRMLKQTVDGSAVKQGCFSDFSRTIMEELNKALEERPSGIYSSEEQASITENIWELLQGIARSKDSRLDLEVRFNKALADEYKVTGVLPKILEEFKIETSRDNLFQMNAFKHIYADLIFAQVRKWSYRPLTEDLKNSLSHAVDDIIEIICKSRGSEEYVKSGLDFEEGMVRQLRIDFPERIKAVEKKFSARLKDDFKIALQIYALQQFYSKMIKLQAAWNKHNSPIGILMEKKDDYKAEIETRLKSGFSSAGEGELFAKHLCKAIKNKAVGDANAENVEKVLSLGWTTNSEKVRLLYFEELAKEVQAGDKQRALKHFDNPKYAIEMWYEVKVNSLLSQRDLVKIYDSSIISELKIVQTKLAKSTRKEDIHEILKHLTDVEDQYFSKLDPKFGDFEAFKSSIENHLNSHLRRYLDIKTEIKSVQAKLANATWKKDIDKIQKHLTDAEDQYFRKLGQKYEDFEVLKNSIDNHLMQYLDKSDDGGIDYGKLDPKDYFGALKNSIDNELCHYLDEISNINFPLASDDDRVKKRIGCTEHCYWCGALCWGARDHQMEKEKTPDMERHHSCHQPQGLTGTEYQMSKELYVISCHNDSDTTRVFFKDFQEGNGMLWSVAKRDHFPEWKFDAHCTTTFDEMMRWFFQELHQDIAKQRGSKPASKNKLQENKCVNLNLEEILKVVHSKI